MKNINYDHLKLLHMKLDNVWRLEKFYVKDAQDAKCHSVACLKKILADEKKHVKMLQEEIKMRIKAGKWD
jgi:DNA gyrase/topoisomerase IV subunit A